MKKASEWMTEEPLGCEDEQKSSWIKQIQLDAWKQGMEDAINSIDVKESSSKDEIIKAAFRSARTTLTLYYKIKQHYDYTKTTKRI